MRLPWYAYSWTRPATGPVVTIYNPTDRPLEVLMVSVDGGRLVATEPELVIAEECQAAAQVADPANQWSE